VDSRRAQFWRRRHIRYKYSPEYNLTRLPPEEAAARLKNLKKEDLRKKERGINSMPQVGFHEFSGKP